MPDQSTNVLQASRREPAGSRDARRLRRTGKVPGIVYGGDGDPVPFAVDGRELRHALANAGAVLDLKLDADSTTPVVLKELVRHPVSGVTTHIDLVRVRLDVAIQAQVPIELTGGEEAVGVKAGGILEQPLRDVTIEALPHAIPDSIQHDVSAMDIGDTITQSALVAPAGVTILGDGDLVLATITASRMARAEDEDGPEIETETELVGEAGAEASAESDAGAGDGDSDAAAE
jgi:large subunit ribosomal protein L25